MALPIPLTLQWKPFKVHLPSLDAVLRDRFGSNYAGNSAGNELTLWFLSPLSGADAQLVNQTWEGLIETNEAAKFAGEAAQNASIQAARNNLANQTWDQMLPAERKLMMSQPLTAEDRTALVGKYP